MNIDILCDYIILIAAVLVAIKNIYEFFSKPANNLKKKCVNELDEKIESSVEDEILKILEKKEKENELKLEAKKTDIIESTKEEILNILKPELDEILIQNKKQNENIDKLMISSKDLLRQRILSIYHLNKSRRTLTINEREILDELYKDYKRENGNSYIDKYYNRMEDWEVIPDEYETI